MTDASQHPYTKLSRKLGASGVLEKLSKGKSALLWLFFVTEGNAQGVVEAAYSQMMAATGIRSAATIASLLDHLEETGLIERLPPHPETGVGRYRLLVDWARFGRPGAPEGKEAGEAEAAADAATTSEVQATSKSEDTLRKVVVEDSRRTVERVNQEDREQQQSLRGTSTCETPVDGRLQKLKLPLTDEGWWALIERYGVEAVVEKARWYHYARRQGLANGLGWLYAALRESWVVPPVGFERRHYLTHKEWLGELAASGVEV